MNYKGYLFIASAACLWGILGPVSSLAFEQGVSPLEVAFFRAFLTWILFACHAGVTNQYKIDIKDIPMLSLFGFLGVTVFYGSLQLAVKNGGIAMASVLLYTAPAWVAIMSFIIFKEKMSVIKIGAVLLTLVGAGFVSVGTGTAATEFSFNSLAILCGLLSGFSYSLYYIFGKLFSEKYSSSTLFTYILPVGALCLLPFFSFSEKGLAAWLCLITIAVFCTYGAYYFYYIGLRYLEPTRAVVTATLEPFVAAVIAFIWWQEIFNVFGYLGSVLIIGSVFMMIWDEKRSARLS